MERLKHFLPSFDRRIWWILLGYTVSLIGTGMTEPYLIIYLHHIRNISLTLSGIIIGSSGLAGVIAIPTAGLLNNWIRTKQIFIFSLFLGSLGRLLFALSINEKIAICAAIVSGAATAASWNALSLILSLSVAKSQKSSIFGVAFALQNLGSGLGAMLGSVLVRSQSTRSFQLIFILDAVTFIIFALFSEKWVMNISTRTVTSQRKKHMYLFSDHIIKNDYKILIFLSSCYALFAIVMTGVSTTLFPQWAIVQAHVSLQVIGDAFLINSLTILAAQLPSLQWIKRTRRTRVIAFAALLFTVGYIVMLIAGFLKSECSALALILSFAVTAFGEIFLFSSLPALVNDLVRGKIKNHFNSVINGAWQIGSIFGPILAGSGLTLHLAIPLFLGYIFILMLLIPSLIFLETLIPIELNRDT
ncbi:MFS transporter [Sporolactobacillus laevolacticus]|uniref:Major facilitator superfamily (MFS) profile domain-containing protein n=1 Tax=Sporolactobacillus laevolacticus DSM 442 TaxID=1395513 RepID=V6J1E7_9BACL|nr:MFS transporter [Sporolactobacillus laevolacticus]EST13640.1 hypothetical protein P343_00100 [Sporolactobacillus laevolacticus DSM 442]